MKNGAKSSLVTLDYADLELRITAHLSAKLRPVPSSILAGLLVLLPM